MSIESFKYPILQSGFLGLNVTGLTKQIPEAPTFADTILFSQRNHEFDNLFYSEEISRLFEEFQSNFHVMRKPEFQHRILEQAMKRFGTSILEWLEFQGNKPSFSQTHMQLLVRMSAWMAPGIEQPAPAEEVVRWVGFLGPLQGQSVEFRVNELKEVSALLNLPEAIVNWVSKPSGYESLLNYLYVIFGKRVGHIQRPTM